MSNQYDPTLELEIYMLVGTAQCTEVTDNFATFEDTGPFTAKQFQVMHDGGWKLMCPSEAIEHPNSVTYIYSFFKDNVL